MESTQKRIEVKLTSLKWIGILDAQFGGHCLFYGDAKRFGVKKGDTIFVEMTPGDYQEAVLGDYVGWDNKRNCKYSGFEVLFSE